VEKDTTNMDMYDAQILALVTMDDDEEEEEEEEEE
jgi:hypothetical protein